MTQTQSVTVLGSTGSIGTSTLDVLARHPERFSVFALTAATQVDLLLAQCQRFAPRYAVMVSEAHARELAVRVRELGLPVEVLAGEQALCDVSTAAPVDAVMAAIVGAAGLAPCLAAARAGKKLLLANKEALVVGGELFMEAVRDGGATLLPIDSEHSAIFQSLPEDAATWSRRVSKIVLTASGGPFRTRDPASLSAVTPQQACAHPNWVMGRKISVDSATMMNKGLEIIEACRLFGVAPERVRVVVHPESIVHSLVEYRDGSMLAQMGNPDMRTPIAHALGWPERIDSGVPPLDLAALGSLSFRAVEERRFPCLVLAMEAARAGGAAPIALNAANEAAVAAFLGGRIRFTAIATVIGAVLAQYLGPDPGELDSILALDLRARASAEDKIRELAL
jgi:1-deoxy-D-xylulose-5-phosphate reductoisomerase